MKKIISKFSTPKQILAQMFLLLLIFCSLGITPVQATGIYDLPNLSAGEQNWIIDSADIISRINKGQLGSDFQKLAEETGQEVRIVTVRHLDYGETIEDLTNNLFERWFPSPEEQENQVLITLDTITNNVGVRLGETAQGLLPEAIAQSIINDTIGVPIRQENKYNQALLNARDRVVAVISGLEDPGAPEVQDTLNIESTFTSAEETDDRNATLWVIILLIVATVVPMATYYFYQSFSG